MSFFKIFILQLNSEILENQSHEHPPTLVNRITAYLFLFEILMKFSNEMLNVVQFCMEFETNAKQRHNVSNF